MHKILISACFLGKNVRYNAIIKPLIHPILSVWQAENRLLSVCPEVTGGLSTPRAPAEFNNKTKTIITNQGENVTEAFEKGAQIALKLCLTNKIKFALLKESSPSCGSHNIYDGSFTNTKITGEGITTQLLRQHGIKVYSELNIEDLITDINTLNNLNSV